MTKLVPIEYCDDCPYSYYAGYDSKVGILYFKCGHPKFPYGKSNWVIKDQILDDCPLDSVIS